MKLETKIQIEALKMLDKGIAPNYAEDMEHFYFMIDEYSALRICRDLFFLDKDNLKENFYLSRSFNSDNLLDTQELIATSELRKLPIGIGVLLKCEGFTTHINEKYLKMFKGCKLFAKDEKSAVYFVRNSEICAMAMPIRLAENV